MIYTEKTRAAMNLCYEVHAGAKDKGGFPYVFHPFYLADQMDDEVSTIVALLHDVVEDTDYTIEDIKEMGFSENVVEALRYMTHDDDVPYMDYVRKIRENPIATKVKLADLAHNSDPSRLMREPEEKDLQRLKKYEEAIRILRDENAEDE